MVESHCVLHHRLEEVAETQGIYLAEREGLFGPAGVIPLRRGSNLKPFRNDE